MSFHLGERSQVASEKEVLNSYSRLLNCRAYREEIVSVGGSFVIAAIDGATRLTAIESYFGHLVVWYVKDDSGTAKTHVSELVLSGGELIEQIVEEAGSSNHLKHTETRDPSIDTSPSAIFYTLGDVVHKLTIQSGNIKATTDLANLTDVTAIAFGDNRVLAVSGRDVYCSDQVAGGDCTDFQNDAQNSWLKGGRFPSTFSQNCTNVEYIGDKVVIFSPNKIEIKTITETQEDISGTIYSVKKLEHYGEVNGVGTRSYRKIGRYGGYLYFMDEDAKEFNRLFPEKDQDGKINPEPILDDEGNMDNLDFSRVTIRYSRPLKEMIISTDTNGEAILFDPKRSNFSRVQWDISDMTEDSEGDFIFTSNDKAQIFKHDTESVLQDGEIMPLEIITNDFAPDEFFKKLKVKRLALWMLANQDAEIALFQSINGGDWKSVSLNLTIQTSRGAFISPYQVVGLTMTDGARRKPDPDQVGVVKGKIRARAKGTTARYKLTVRSRKPFTLKYWGIPKASISSFMKNNYITVNQDD